MFVFYLSALLSLAAALRPEPEARQLAYSYQPQASDYAWDRIDIEKLHQQLDDWNNESLSSSERPVIPQQARQGYPEIPQPISPIRPPPPPVEVHLPKGCLAPRGQFPSPRSCAHYYNCWDDVVIEQQCPGGLLFNEFLGYCDFEYNTYCAGRPGLPPKPDLPPGAKKCPDPNGRYRSSTNCSEFYVCVYGKPIKYSCPRGLVYNEDLGVCDYPFRVDCRGATVPEPWKPPTQPPPTKPPRPTQPSHPQPPHYPPQQPPHYPPQQPQEPHHPPQQPQQPHYPPQQPQQPHYPPQQPQQPHYPPQQPQQPHYPPQQPHPQPPHQPQYPQPPQHPPYVPQPPHYHGWGVGEARKETDPWHQRPVAAEFELQQADDKKAKEQQQALLQQLGEQGVSIASNIQQDAPQAGHAVHNPWAQIPKIPEHFTKVPCKNGDVHRLTDSCSRVLVCRNNRPELVQCPTAEIYDKPSDSCKPFTLAKC